MPLRAVKPKEIQKRLKALFYGKAGSGKTTAAVSFPKPYLIDTEKGSENGSYIKILEERGGSILQTSDFEEITQEVKSLLTEKHDYKTLVIDPLTIPYDQLLGLCGLKVGTEFGRHYSEAKKHMNNLISLLYRLDMNVIITSQAKNEYGNNMVVIGQTYDCFKGLDYAFDLVFEVEKRGKHERVAQIKKSRIEAFPDGDVIPFSYEEIVNRYGKEILERDVVIQRTASESQIQELEHLINIFKIQPVIVQKWLDKEKVDSFEYLTHDYAERIIQTLQQKMKGAA